MIKRFYPYFIMVLLLFSTFGKLTAQDNTQKERPWWLGLNGGAAWQKGDVRARLGYGLGLTLEKSLIYNNTSLIGMSLRGRYLFTSTSGQDYKRSYGILNNEALNGTNGADANYASTLGYVYQNYKTSIHDFDLELLLNTNRLRARKGVNLYIFGGIGSAGSRTSIDQLDQAGNQYDYNSVSNFSKGNALLNLNNLKDKKYETTAEGSSNRKYVFAPSFGGGINFRVVPNFWVGFEHKITFPKTDLLDGQRWKNDNTLSNRNDLYHYTNFNMNIGLFGGTHSSTTKANVASPVIDLLFPTTEVYNALDCKVSMSIRVSNVVGRSAVQVRQDGAVIADYNYSASGVITFSRTLTGNSVFVVSATNGSGTVSRTIRVNCVPRTTPYKEIPNEPSPEVTIVRPSINPFISTTCYETIVAKVKNVTDKSQISVVINNNPLYASLFDYNPVNQEVSFNTHIAAASFVQIFVYNKGGKTSDMVEIRCKPPVVSPKSPTIEIRNPANNPHVSASCEELVTAYVTNVFGKENIQALLNGVQVAAQDVIFDKHANQVAIRVSISGTSTLLINVNNPYGVASDKLTLVCGNGGQRNPNAPSPTVQILKPAVSLYTSVSCEEDIIAIVRNVSGKENIHILLGTMPLTGAEYSFDPTNGRLTFHAAIVNDEQITITAVNEVGKAHDGVTINCVPVKPIVPAPTVQINSPSVSPFISINCEEDVVALVRNVKTKENIQVIVNGVFLKAWEFNFDPTTGKLLFHTIIASSSSVSINVSNESGKATDAITLTCAPKKEKLPAPTVQITAPSVDPFISIKCEEDVFATIRNVSSKDAIKVAINGLLLSTDQYTFDSPTGRLTFHLSIKQTNSIIVTAKNESGEASDKLTITCAPPKEKIPVPTIQFTAPTIDPYISMSCEEDVLATVRNVKTKDNILILLNSVALGADEFTFDPISGRVAFHRSIKEVTTIVITATNESGAASDKTTISCVSKKGTVPAPTVQITSPTIDPYISLSCEEDITAIVRNVKTKDNVKVVVNTVDMASDDYSFEPTTGKLTFHLSIKQANEVTITAINEAGIASDKVTVSCVVKKDKLPAPTVQILTPTIDPYISISCDETITATVRNILLKENIFVVVNGQTLPGDQFSFDAKTGQLSFHLFIKMPNAIVITATNETGVATDKVTISCAPSKEKIPVPTVQITKPSNDPFISISCEDDITATVRNVTSKDKIQIMINSVALTTEDFMFDASNGLLSFHLPIKTATSIVINASNESGSASDKTTITCAPPKEKIPEPTVQLTKPSIDPYISISCEEDINATVRNVKSKEKIQVIVNSLPLPLDQFTFDASTGLLSFHLSLKDPNTIVITATNESGVASEKTTITCAPAKEKIPVPTVQITLPTSDPYISVKCEEDIAVFIRNVKSKENITVSANGIALSDEAYAYDASSGRLTLRLVIKQSTIIQVTAINESGSASDKITINCVPPVVIPIPIVKITSPISDPYVSVDCEEKIIASVKNVTDNTNIKITINGHLLYPEQYTFDLATKNISFVVKIDKTATVIVSAKNESGTATDQVSLTCTPPKVDPVIIIPPFAEGNDCPAASPSKYIDCESCHFSDDDNKNSLTVESGKKVCIKGIYTGQITMNGGTLVICGNAKPSSINFNTGTIIINGEATFASLNLNNSNCTVRNFGTLILQGTTFNGRMENYGIMTVGSDCNVNTLGVFKNTGEINIKGSVNNSNVICNSGTMNVSVNLHNNSGGSFVNSCKVIVANEFHNNSTFENNGYVKSGGKTIINGGSNFIVSGGNKLEVGALDFNGTITGVGSSCSSVLVSGISSINGGASLNGNVSICDANGIEQNNSGGKITSTCSCSIAASGCVPASVVIVKELVPTIQITYPTSSTVVSLSCEETIVATVKNCKEKVSISVLIDGQKLATEKYTFDVGTGKVSLNVTFEKTSTVEIIATNTSGSASDKVVLTCTPPKTDVKKIDFVIDKGTVVPKQCYYATVVILGCALKEGGVGIDYPVVTQVNFGNTTVDPFGIYSGYNKASNVNDHVTHTWNSPQPIPANTAISVKAKSINPRTYAQLYERNSSGVDPFVKVLRNGETVPIISGFAGQADVETYLNGYIVDGKVKLESNQAIYLFELGTNSTSSKSNDMQDCVVLVTLTPAEASANCSGVNEEEEKKKREEAEKVIKIKEEEERIKKAKEIEVQNQKVKEEADKKQKEKEETEKLQKEKEETDKANEKVSICHKPPGNPENFQTLVISRSALQAHLDHGDHLGDCGEEEKLKKEKEEADKIKVIKDEEERIAKEKNEKERKANEELGKIEKEQKIKEEQEKAEKENADREKKAKEDTERIEREKSDAEKVEKENSDREKKAKEDAERIERDRVELEKAEKEKSDRENKVKEDAERIEREKAEKENSDREKKAKEDAEQMEREKAEKENADREKKAKEDAERIERENDQLERERKSKEEADRKRFEQEEADRQEKLKQDELNNQKAKEEAEKKRRELDQLNKQKRDKEEAEKQKREKEEAEKQQREKEETDRQEKDKEEAEKKAKDEAEKTKPE